MWTHNWKLIISPPVALTLHYCKQLNMCGECTCASRLRGEGQCSALGDHDGDILGPGVSSETQENGDGGETHVSDKRTRGVEALVAVATIGAFMIEPAEG
jgi:hypothetical protein